MADSNSPSNPPSNSPSNPPRPRQVSEELVKKLHDADERFSSARQRREEAMDLATPDGAGRERAQQEMRDAEKEVEAVQDEIERDLHKPE